MNSAATLAGATGVNMGRAVAPAIVAAGLVSTASSVATGTPRAVSRRHFGHEVEHFRRDDAPVSNK